MPRYYRKPAVVEAFQWDRHADEKTWPEWARLYRGRDTVGALSGLGQSAVGTLLVPGNGLVQNANPGDWLVFDGEIVEAQHAERIARGELTILTPAKFAELYEPEGEATANTPQAAVEQTEGQPS